ncbi:uncharacterized protein RJT21DRAFT_12595 [Scheffersomyces amazonensis]|uniref:uncharacterized protein n=1 Tax=Scheffersomyces amazonensis TaxID=1078765 RepID=UPI00315CD927
MFGYKDDKLRYLRAISFRNLYSKHDKIDGDFNHHLKSINVNSTTSKSGRRNSILPNFDNIETQEGGLELLNRNNRTLLDTFYSLHLVIERNEDKLIYVSEIQYCDMSPNFSSISLPFIPTTSQSHKIIVKLWYRSIFNAIDSTNDDSWNLLSVYKINLRNLVFLGHSLNIDDDYFNYNSMVLNLSGRFYTLPDSLKININQLKLSKKKRRQTSREKLISNSYSYDSIRSILKLSKSLKELHMVKHNLLIQFSEAVHSLKKSSGIETLEESIGRLRFKIGILEKSLSKQKTVNENLIAEILRTKLNINELKELITDRAAKIQEIADNSVELLSAELEPIEENLGTYVFPSIMSQISLFAKVLREVFEIENIDNSVRFSILGLEFPSNVNEMLDICYYGDSNSKPLSRYKDVSGNINIDPREANICQINSGLAYIVQVMNIIANITNCDLKYKMLVLSDSIIILDPTTDQIIDLKNQKQSNIQDQVTEYLLNYDGTKTERIANDRVQNDSRKYIYKNQNFEHALNLLNKNLVFLINNTTGTYNNYHRVSTNANFSNNIPVDCLDNFLWNLQYLLLFLTAPVDQE